MKTLVKSAIVALALAGASMVGGGAVAPAQAQNSFGFYLGPDGSRVYFNQGMYRDRAGQRHYYRYPRDYRRYRYNRDYYRSNPYWYRDRDWYRR